MELNSENYSYVYDKQNYLNRKCSTCLVIYRNNKKKYRDINKEIIKTKRENNKVKEKEYREKYKKNKTFCRIKSISNEEKLRRKKYNAQYRKIKLQECSDFKFKAYTRNLIYNSFKRCLNGKYVKSSRSEEILGCSLNDFKIYIQSLFKKGMTLQNYGKWHLDHVIPLSNVKNIDEILLLNHYTNLRPLWALENIIKKDSIIEIQLKLI